MKTPLLASLILLAVAPVFASGVLTISGELVSITSTDFVVKTATATYKVHRKSIEPEVAKKYDRPAKHVELTVPFEAVEPAKPIRK